VLQSISWKTSTNSHIFSTFSTLHSSCIFVGSVYKTYQTKPLNGGVRYIPNVHITDSEDQLTTKDVRCSIFSYRLLTKYVQVTQIMYKLAHVSVKMAWTCCFLLFCASPMSIINCLLILNTHCQSSLCVVCTQD